MSRSIAERMRIGDGDRLHRRTGEQRRLIHAGMEFPQAFPIPGGPFRKQRQGFVAPQLPAHRLNQSLTTAHVAAAQKQRPQPARHPADQGPTRHFCLGDKAGWGNGVQSDNVEPGDVVGDPQRPTCCGMSFEKDAQSQPPTKATEPVLHQTVTDTPPAYLPGEPGGDQDQGHQNQGIDDMKSEPGSAPDPNQAVGAHAATRKCRA